MTRTPSSFGAVQLNPMSMHVFPTYEKEIPIDLIQRGLHQRSCTNAAPFNACRLKQFSTTHLIMNVAARVPYIILHHTPFHTSSCSTE